MGTRETQDEDKKKKKKKYITQKTKKVNIPDPTKHWG